MKRKVTCFTSMALAALMAVSPIIGSSVSVFAAEPSADTTAIQVTPTEDESSDEIVVETDSDAIEVKEEKEMQASVKIGDSGESDIEIEPEYQAGDSVPLHVTAENPTDTDADFRLYFWNYADTLPEDKAEWFNVLTDVCENVKVAELQDTDKYTVDLKQGDDTVQGNVSFTSEKDEEDNVTAAYLSVNIPAGAVLDTVFHISSDIVETATIVSLFDAGEDNVSVEDAAVVEWIENPVVVEKSDTEDAAETESETEDVDAIVVETEDPADSFLSIYVGDSDEETSGTEESVVDVESETEKSEAEAENDVSVEADVETEESADLVVVQDTTELNASDFASMRLVILTDDASVITNDSDVIGQYGNVYLLQFTSIQQTMNAYVYYKNKVDAVEPDVAVEMASDTETETEVETEAGTETETETETEMTALEESQIAVDEEMNPIMALNELEVSPETQKEHGVIALIDTGVEEHENVIDRVSVIDDVLEGNGHGEDMLNAIVSQDAEAKVLSIRAMDDKGLGTISSLVAAMEYAIEQDVDIINLSLYAKATLSTSVLEQEILKANDAGILVVGSAGNDGKDVIDYMPGAVEEAYIIGAADTDGTRREISNFGATVDYNVVAESTSEAAAIFTGFVSANGREAVEDVLNQGLIYATDFTSEIVTDEPEEETSPDYVGVSPEEEAMYEAGLISDIEPNLTKTYTADQLAEDLPDGTFTVAAGDTTVREYGSDALEDAAGVNRASIMSWLSGHVSTNYYLSTPYNPGWVENSGMSADFRNPNGDCGGAYGAADKPGVPGMNCTGFVWHALTKAGGTGIPGISGWVTFLRNNNIKYRTYTGTNFNNIINTILYEDDWIEPGDIIWMWDASAGNMQNGLCYGVSNYHHIGIYIGAEFDNSNPYNASPGWFFKNKGDINGFWHSSEHGVPHPGNIITNISPKTTCTSITVVKTSDVGYLKLNKSSTLPNVSNDNRCYSLGGAEYTVYKTRNGNTLSDAVGTFVTKNDGTTDVMALAPGRYYVRETKAPKGFEINQNIYTVNVTVSNTTTAPYQLNVEDVPGNDPTGIEITKIWNGPETDTIPTLEGTQFTIKYYDGYYTKDNLPSTPKRTWVLEVKKDKNTGKFITGLADSYLVEGSDEFYRDGSGLVCLPYGTISIQETKPAAGYTLEGYLTDENGKTISTDSEVYVAQINKDTGAVALQGGNKFTGYNTPVFGSIKLKKYDSDGKTPLAGVTFQCVGKTVEDVYTATTDSNGEIVFDNLYPDVYTITETSTVDGHTLLKEPIVVEVPMRVTEEYINEFNVDRDSVTYDPADDIYYIHEFTYEITNDVTFKMPMSGGLTTPMTFVPLIAGMGILGGLGVVGFCKKRKK